MLEEHTITMEEAIQFLNVLESENEEELLKIVEMIQDAEQKMREVEYSLREYDQKEDTNLNFFSPVGIYEEREEKSSFLQTSEELKDKLEELNSQLEKYKYRGQQIGFIRTMICSTQKEAEATQSSDEKIVVSKQNQGLHILESLEYDRNRIARDLHDSAVQSLTAMTHKTELCIRLMDIDTVRVRLELQTIHETIKSIINGMREIIYNLRPMSLENLGLAVTIDAYCLQLKKNYDIEVLFHNLSEEPELPFLYKVTLYRILQEACSNVIKHANASKIEVMFSNENDNMKLVITDNGTGFDTKKATESADKMYQGFGLTMMKERIELLGGRICIESAIGKGTKVSVEIPLSEKEEKTGND